MHRLCGGLVNAGVFLHRLGIWLQKKRLNVGLEIQDVEDLTKIKSGRLFDFESGQCTPTLKESALLARAYAIDTEEITSKINYID